MNGVHSGARRTLAFAGGVLAGCAIARMAMRAIGPATRKRGAAPT